jgi:hypothetical protein
MNMRIFQGGVANKIIIKNLKDWREIKREMEVKRFLKLILNIHIMKALDNNKVNKIL